MKRPPSSRFWLLLALLVVPLAADEILPTPYTAEEVRDAWVEGFEVTTRTRSAEGEIYSRTRVIAWSETGFGLVEIQVDERGRPLKRDVSRYTGTWEELRAHALFPVSRASRERTEWDTPLGQLEGWLYLVRGEEGTMEFFFADDLPGPPVVSRRQGEGLDGFIAEQISREVKPSEE